MQKLRSAGNLNGSESPSWVILLQLCKGKSLPVFLGRHPIFLPESPEKAGVILEAVGEADLADLLVHHDGVPAGGQSFLEQVLVNGNTEMFLKSVGNMVLADEEVLSQAVEGDILLEILVDISHHLLVQAAGRFARRGIDLVLDGPAQEEKKILHPDLDDRFPGEMAAVHFLEKLQCFGKDRIERDGIIVKDVAMPVPLHIIQKKCEVGEVL